MDSGEEGGEVSDDMQIGKFYETSSSDFLHYSTCRECHSIGKSKYFTRTINDVVVNDQ